jgi:hypothetical protein
LKWQVGKADEGAVQARETGPGAWEVSFEDRPEPVQPVYAPSQGKKKTVQKKE